MPITDVADAMREFKAGTSKHIRSRKQAIAVGLSAQRRAAGKRGKVKSRGMTRGRY